MPEHENRDVEQQRRGLRQRLRLPEGTPVAVLDFLLCTSDRLDLGALPKDWIPAPGGMSWGGGEGGGGPKVDLTPQPGPPPGVEITVQSGEFVRFTITATVDGGRIVLSGEAPWIEKGQEWLDRARTSLAARGKGFGLDGTTLTKVAAPRRDDEDDADRRTGQGPVRVGTAVVSAAPDKGGTSAFPVFVDDAGVVSVGTAETLAGELTQYLDRFAPLSPSLWASYGVLSGTPYVTADGGFVSTWGGARDAFGADRVTVLDAGSALGAFFHTGPVWPAGDLFRFGNQGLPPVRIVWDGKGAVGGITGLPPGLPPDGGGEPGPLAHGTIALGLLGDHPMVVERPPYFRWSDEAGGDPGLLPDTIFPIWAFQYGVRSSDGSVATHHAVVPVAGWVTHDGGAPVGGATINLTPMDAPSGGSVVLPPIATDADGTWKAFLPPGRYQFVAPTAPVEPNGTWMLSLDPADQPGAAALPEEVGFDWTSISPRLGLTYALESSRRGLLDALRDHPVAAAMTGMATAGILTFGGIAAFGSGGDGAPDRMPGAGPGAGPVVGANDAFVECGGVVPVHGSVAAVLEALGSGGVLPRTPCHGFEQAGGPVGPLPPFDWGFPQKPRLGRPQIALSSLGGTQMLAQWQVPTNTRPGAVEGHALFACEGTGESLSQGTVQPDGTLGGAATVPVDSRCIFQAGLTAPDGTPQPGSFPWPVLAPDGSAVHSFATDPGTVNFAPGPDAFPGLFGTVEGASQAYSSAAAVVGSFFGRPGIGDSFYPEAFVDLGGRPFEGFYLEPTLGDFTVPLFYRDGPVLRSPGELPEVFQIGGTAFGPPPAPALDRFGGLRHGWTGLGHVTFADPGTNPFASGAFAEGGRLFVTVFDGALPFGPTGGPIQIVNGIGPERDGDLSASEHPEQVFAQSWTTRFTQDGYTLQRHDGDTVVGTDAVAVVLNNVQMLFVPAGELPDDPAHRLVVGDGAGRPFQALPRPGLDPFSLPSAFPTSFATP
jgi:hypothetical protein